jgi:uncharacterized membrane protein YbaN (DUF454 family)
VTRIAKRIAGTMFLLVGAIGIFLPLMPGVIFIIIGSALLGSKHRFVEKIKSMMPDRSKSKIFQIGEMQL